MRGGKSAVSRSGGNLGELSSNRLNPRSIPPMAEAEKACEDGTEEYESGLDDDGPLSVVRRRGAASDDDEEEAEGGGGSRRGSPPPSTVLGSESEDSGGQGAAELYDEEEEEVYGTEEEDAEYEDVREESEGGGGGAETGVVNGEVYLQAADEGKYEDDEAAGERDEKEEATMEGEEVKKASDSEPYAVPTTGVFYQHDNRFQGRNHGYQRQFCGGQKIWVPKEEAVWAHDLFNEINFHDNKYDDVSIMHSGDNGYFHGSKSYYDTKSFDNVKQTQFDSYYGNTKGYSDERNVYRERGSRTNRSRRTIFRISSAQNNTKSYSKSQDAEVSYNEGMEKHSSQTSLQHEQNLPCNQIFGSSTNSAPPAIYSDTRSTHRELPFMQREKARCVTFNKLFSSAVHKAHLQHEQTLTCKQAFGSFLPPFYSSRSTHQQHCNQPRNAVYKQRSIQRPILPTPRVSAKLFVQKVTSTNTIQAHPLTTLASSSGDGARGSMFDDPGSSNTTAKLPVMLFSGLHPKGPGFPSDAVVLPEFVDQRRGGDSEMRLMAWESRSTILTGTTGVQLGTISPPCLQHSELESSLASPSGHGVRKVPMSLTSQDPISLTYQKIPEVVGHEFVHLQNRTRRYSEMSFAL